jgi:hypothetical protein
MPYLRLYSQDVPIDQKRVIAQKLIEITLHTFHLRPEERNRITIQFVPLSQLLEVDGLQPVEVDGLRPAIPRDVDVMLEVMGHHLTGSKKRAFTEALAAMSDHLLPVKPVSWIARLLGFDAAAPSQIALRFKELSPAISDAFVMDDPEYRAA